MDIKKLREFFKKDFTSADGIVSFQVSGAIIKKVTEFYDVAPFPNYKDNNNKSTILERGNKNHLSHRLKEFIGFNRCFFEVWSGTSQLSNYIGSTRTC